MILQNTLKKSGRRRANGLQLALKKSGRRRRSELQQAFKKLKTRRRNKRGYLLPGLAGAAVATAVTYLADPRSGSRRRAIARDKAIRAAHQTGDAFGKTARDIAHRTRGMVAETVGRLNREPVDDSTLQERVRAELGRVCSHPGAIEVAAQDGLIRLRGPVLKSEHRRVLRNIARVHGVEQLEDELEVYREPGNIPALQGGAGMREPRPELLQTHWAPAPRVGAGACGLALASWGAVTRSPVAIGLGIAGLALLARSASNRPFKRLLGIGAGRRAIDLEKQIHINAPVEEVFAFWRELENFPRFMTHVKEVRQISDRRYRWKVEGPVGLSFEWDADISGLVPNELVAWRSAEGALVRNAGIVRFEPDARGGTRINIRMQYNPPAGAIGHAFARLLGSDPKRQMDDDLVRLKSLIEEGKATGAEQTVTKEQMAPERSQKDFSPGWESLP